MILSELLFVHFQAWNILHFAAVPLGNCWRSEIVSNAKRIKNPRLIVLIRNSGIECEGLPSHTIIHHVIHHITSSVILHLIYHLIYHHFIYHHLIYHPSPHLSSPHLSPITINHPSPHLAPITSSIISPHLSHSSHPSPLTSPLIHHLICHPSPHLSPITSSITHHLNSHPSPHLPPITSSITHPFIRSSVHPGIIIIHLTTTLSSSPLIRHLTYHPHPSVCM